eukprot:CAMPEP_0184489120 /NCGR_PEP_ID=MMETSP0113_2-20130426/14465_1 /TAXON_ID=91329 /ORGANISM="Norrisiella sphaerica, Strain BC52" /LENGTH=458 /DNA_ID=CAMNT_0026872359 /DNA_START=202 /DNA_END=1578 /DNA_ORIENTATION=-
MGICSSQDRDEAIEHNNLERPPHEQPNTRRPRSPINSGRAGVTSTGERESITSDMMARLGSRHYPGFDSNVQRQSHSAGSAKKPTVQRTSWTPDKQRSTSAIQSRSPYGAVPVKGEAVAVVGLQKTPEYNGRVGIIKALPLNNFVRARSNLRRKPRYAVYLPGWSQLLNIRMENLCVLDRLRVPVVVKDGISGLDFHKDDCGWLVTAVSNSPVQTHIQKRDIIIAVDGKSLMSKTSEEQSRLIKRHLVNGAEVDVLRTPFRNRPRDYSTKAKRTHSSKLSSNKKAKKDTTERQRRPLSMKTHDLIPKFFQKIECKGKEGSDEEPSARLQVACDLFIYALMILRSKRHPKSELPQIRAWAEGRAAQIATHCSISFKSSCKPSQNCGKSKTEIGSKIEETNEAQVMQLSTFTALFENLEESQYSDASIESALEMMIRTQPRLKMNEILDDCTEILAAELT